VDPITWATVGTFDNRFRQDREKMKAGNFTGIAGIPNQDISMWVSMGAVVNRTDDILGASDLAIVEFRRVMVEAAKTVAAGGPAIGSDPAILQTAIASFQGVVPKEADWRELWHVNVLADH
jgi:phthalate 4,5-dioxygenase